MKNVTEHLVENQRFTLYRETRPDPYGIDVERLSCVKRISDLHYLCYSEDYGHFSIRVVHDKPKGGQGKKPKDFHGDTKKQWTSVMVPRVCRTIDIADEIVNAICG